MRDLIKKVKGSLLAILIPLSCAFLMVGSVSGTQPDTSITITNNSSRDILHLYVSPPDHDAWGPDQLAEGSFLGRGQTVTLSNVSCTASGVKLIAEDRQGCFVYALVSGTEATNTWNITNDLPLDCGN